jgi:electron-transferring-flavoprotein dehydrogenase
MEPETIQRESMEFDVLIVGAGPAGLSAACRLRQLAIEAGTELSVCVLEKGAEVGAHIMAGTVFEPSALQELFPNWRDLDTPVSTPVSHDELLLLQNATHALHLPDVLVPRDMRNTDNYIISLGELCIWLAQQAQDLGAEIYAGFVAAELLHHDDGSVRGVLTGDMGRGNDGQPKDNFLPGMELVAKYTLFTEGSRGHLGKQLIAQFQLDKHSDPQHYGLGIKELWQIDPALHKPGLVLHATGWPLAEHDASGGAFLYHFGKDQVYVGLITDLNYTNPYLSPFDEFQRLKLHPAFRRYLTGGQRISYGARTITKGGYNSLPKMVFPGGLLLGCDAGTLNVAKMKGTHTAMKTGMLGAESVFTALQAGSLGGEVLNSFTAKYKASWVYKELYESRNFAPALHKCNPVISGGIAWVEQNLLCRSFPFTLHDVLPDFAQLKAATFCEKIAYAKPDNLLTFDRLSSVFLANTQHEADQPCHLKLHDPELPIRDNLPRFAEPAQRYCPAGVYEVIQLNDQPADPANKQPTKQSYFQINAENCIHCKACDIKDPTQNITWTPPEGGSGPNYSGM